MQRIPLKFWNPSSAKQTTVAAANEHGDQQAVPRREVQALPKIDNQCLRQLSSRHKRGRTAWQGTSKPCDAECKVLRDTLCGDLNSHRAHCPSVPTKKCAFGGAQQQLSQHGGQRRSRRTVDFEEKSRWKRHHLRALAPRDRTVHPGANRTRAHQPKIEVLNEGQGPSHDAKTHMVKPNRSKAWSPQQAHTQREGLEHSHCTECIRDGACPSAIRITSPQLLCGGVDRCGGCDGAVSDNILHFRKQLRVPQTGYACSDADIT